MRCTAATPPLPCSRPFLLQTAHHVIVAPTPAPLLLAARPFSTEREINQGRVTQTYGTPTKKRAALGSLRPGERESHPGFLKAIREFVLSRPTSPKSRSPRPGPPRPGTSPPPTPSPPHQPQRYFNPRNPAMLTDSCRNLVDLAIFRQAFIEKYLTCSRPMQAFWLG